MLILNVDDDSDDREMFQAAINAIDPKIDCLVFESGIKLIEYLTHTVVHPNYLFVDINMSKMNGYECVQQMYQIQDYDQTQIVMYSTAFDPRRKEKLVSPNVSYLKKTSSFSELIQSIRTLLLESRESAEKLKM